MQRLEVSGAVRPLQWSLGVKGLISHQQILVLHIFASQLQDLGCQLQ